MRFDNQIQQPELPPPNHPTRVNAIIDEILKNRGFSQEDERERFLNPVHPTDLTPEEVGIDPKQLDKLQDIIRSAIKENKKIIVYGDYDCDGVCATAIVWEILHNLGGDTMPYIPHRQEEGFGLSKYSLDNIRKEYPDSSLLITVDTGITNHEEVRYARDLGFSVIITDHHHAPEELPDADSIIHSTELSGAGIAWMIAHRLDPALARDSLDLAALATVADMVPLVGPNRSLVYHGITSLEQSKRPGMDSLMLLAGIDRSSLNTYQVSHIIAPRINAAGRIEHALDALRLLCTTKRDRARNLAKKLEDINRQRQQLTENAVEKAKSLVSPESSSLLFVADESFHEGVIGLVASRLVNEFSRPAVVVSKGEKISKASARSMPGFSITQAIKDVETFLIDGGGHEMAGGFTARTDQLDQIASRFALSLSDQLTESRPDPKPRLEIELHPSDIDWPLVHALEQLEPHGTGNPAPIFQLKQAHIDRTEWVGKDKSHLKLFLSDISLWAIGFRMNEQFPPDFNPDRVDLKFTLGTNTWRGKTEISLKLRKINPEV